MRHRDYNSVRLFHYAVLNGPFIAWITQAIISPLDFSAQPIYYFCFCKCFCVSVDTIVGVIEFVAN